MDLKLDRLLCQRDGYPQEHVGVSSMTKDKKLGLLILIIIFGLFSALIFHLFMGVVLGRGYPYNTFLFRPDDRFMDFFNQVRGSSERDPYNPLGNLYFGGYLPFGYATAFFISLLRPWYIAFLIFFFGFIGFLWIYTRQALFNHEALDRRKHLIIFCLAFLTYPVIFSLDRSNFDIFIFIFITIFVYFFQKKNYTTSALILALPIAMKGYPLVLAVFFLFQRRYRDFFLTGFLVAALELGSLAFFKDGLVMEFGKMLASYSNTFTVAFEQGAMVRFNASLYVFLIYFSKSFAPYLAQNPLFIRLYSPTMVIVFGLVSANMLLRKLPFWRQYLLITLMMILFPYSSGDYRLLFIYPPMLMFLTQKDPCPTDLWMTVLFGLLLIPKAYIVFEADINLGILLNPLILMALFVITLWPTNPVLTNSHAQPISV
jgi:hypothetical protein